MLASFDPTFGSTEGESGEGAGLAGGALPEGVVVVVVDDDGVFVVPLALVPPPPAPTFSGEPEGTVVVGSGEDGRVGSGNPSAFVALATAPVMVGTRELSVDEP